MNRSMEAHAALAKRGFSVRSFGTGAQVKLPGPSIDKPNVYSFGTPYAKIYEDLKQQNPELYRQNGLLNLLERNMKIKPAPERWHDQKHVFDVIVTFEEKVFDLVVEEFQTQGSSTFQPVYIFDLNVKDNHEDAIIGAQHTCTLCHTLAQMSDWEDRIDQILEDFQRKTGRQVLHTIQFY